MAKEIVIPYSPREVFEAFHDSGKRWAVLICHRRAGKTVATINHLIRDAIRKPNTQYAFIEPTYVMAKRIVWEYVKEFTTPLPGMKYNEAELRADFATGSRIYLLGAEKPDSLRGLALDGVVFDEYSQQPANIFGEIIRPALLDREGYGIWIGTIKGKNHLHRLWEKHKNDPEWFSMYLRASESGIISASELADAKKEMAEDEYMQEMELEPTAFVRGAYYTKELREMRDEGRIKTVPYDPVLKVHTVWDLGIGKNLAIGFYQASGRERRMIDFWEGSEHDGIPQAAKMLQNKEYIYGKHFAPHDVKATEQGTGKTKIETAAKLGIHFEVVRSMSIGNGINAGQLFFANLWVDEKRCQLWLDYIAQYRREWDENRGMFKDKPYHDFTSHAGDCHRYAAIVEDQMTNDEPDVYDQPEWEPMTEYEG